MGIGELHDALREIGIVDIGRSVWHRDRDFGGVRDGRGMSWP